MAKRIKGYKGYTVKMITWADFARGDVAEYQVGNHIVCDRDGNVEFDDAETLEAAMEQIDGLVEDRAAYVHKQKCPACKWVRELDRPILKEKLDDCYYHLDESEKHVLVLCEDCLGMYERHFDERQLFEELPPVGERSETNEN